MNKTDIVWFPSVAGGTYFAFVGDFKLVRVTSGQTTYYIVQKSEHGMPVGPSATFDYMDDALDWIGN